MPARTKIDMIVMSHSPEKIWPILSYCDISNIRRAWPAPGSKHAGRCRIKADSHNRYDSDHGILFWLWVAFGLNLGMVVDCQHPACVRLPT